MKSIFKEPSRISFEEFQNLVRDFSNNYLFGNTHIIFTDSSDEYYLAKVGKLEIKYSCSYSQWYVTILDFPNVREELKTGEGYTLEEAYRDVLGV